MSRRNPKAYKNLFGHVLILAGSARMAGAAALSSLAAMRSGAGLVTVGIPKSINNLVQRKISSVVMTLPLAETAEGTTAFAAFRQLKPRWDDYQSVAIGPGMTMNPGTVKFVRAVIGQCDRPLVIDADALNALSSGADILLSMKTPKVLTPHPGEMARLLGCSTSSVEDNREKTAREFSRRYQCVVLLKGHQTVVARPEGKIYLNRTGNPGMATAGCGDVLTGMIAAFLGQGLGAFEAAKFAAYLHGRAGDLAARDKGKAALIATDVIEFIPQAFRSLDGKT